MKTATKVVILLLTGCMHSTWSSQSDDLLTLTPPKKSIAVAVTPPTQVVKEEVPTTSKVVTSVSPASGTKGVVGKLDYDEDEGLDGLDALFSQMAIQGDYLGLGRVNPSQKKYVISMCPMNSSGDIYHILAYVILSLAQVKDIPPIVLTYDGTAISQHLESKMNTYSQVERSLQFCEWLGYKQHFGVLGIETGKCQRQNNRQSELVDGLAAQAYTHYADQKALTTVIAKYFRQNGRAAAAATLKRGFEQCDFINKDLPRVKQAALAEVTNIKHHKGMHPLIMMHMRYSSNANETQNPLVNLVGMKDFLEAKGNKVWFVFADGRSSGSFAEITDHRTNVFPYPHSTKKYAGPNPANLGNTVDYGKFYHLQILLGLLPLNDVRFIGNTSGTLDVAAFVGHQVYNMHALAESLNYQTARILIQSAFLAVECLPCSIIKVPVESKKDPGKTRNQIVLSGDYNPVHLSAWIASGTKPANSHVEDYLPHREGNGYKELFYVQALQAGGVDVDLF